MDIEEAVRAACAINPAVVIPMHHLEADPMEFKHKVESQSDTCVILLQTGQENCLPYNNKSGYPGRFLAQWQIILASFIHIMKSFRAVQQRDNP